MSFTLQYAPWLAWIVPAVGALLVPVVAKIHQKVVGWYAVSIAALSAVFTVSLIPSVLEAKGGVISESMWIQVVDLRASVLVDPLSVLIVNVASLIGTLIVLYSIGYMKGEEGLPRYFFFMLLFISGMVGLVLAGNLLQMYVFWEVVGLCSYALIGFWYRRPSAARAGMKAFVVTRIGDVFLLAGILMLYVHTGTFDFLEAKSTIETGRATLPLLTIATFMLLGAVGKSAQVPLHVWLPDAMEGPTPVSALIHAATMVKAGIYLVARIFVLFSTLPAWLTTVAYIGGVTALLAAAMALVNPDMKRILAYSTISQLGVMMAALGVGTELGWFSSQFHLLSHAIFKSLLFLCAGAVMHAVGTTDVSQMGGLRRSMPITFGASLVGAFSLAGIPPFNGFWSKDLVLASILDAGHYALLVFIIGTSVLTVAYSIRWISLIFLGEKSDFVKGVHVHEAPPVMLIPLVVLAALSVVSGFLEGPFEEYTGLRLATHGEASALAILASALIIATGGIAAFLVYLRRSVPAEQLRRGSALGGLHRLLSNGFYFDAVYRRVFIDGVLLVCWNAFRGLEVSVFDRFNYFLADVIFQASRSIRRIQTGVLSYNMAYVMLFVLVVLVWLLAAGVLG